MLSRPEYRSAPLRRNRADRSGRAPPRPPKPVLQVVLPAAGALTAMLVAATAPLESALPCTTAHLPTTSASAAAAEVLVYVVELVTVTERSVVWLVVGSVTVTTMTSPETDDTVPEAR